MRLACILFWRERRERARERGKNSSGEETREETHLQTTLERVRSATNTDPTPSKKLSCHVKPAHKARVLFSPPLPQYKVFHRAHVVTTSAAQRKHAIKWAFASTTRAPISWFGGEPTDNAAQTAYPKRKGILAGTNVPRLQSRHMLASSII
eukprot:scaffold2785_cov291-Pinguiococcus_pyrenoidosus.AAC.4